MRELSHWFWLLTYILSHTVWWTDRSQGPKWLRHFGPCSLRSLVTSVFFEGPKWSGTEVTKDRSGCNSEERLRHLGLKSLETRRIRGDLIEVFKGGSSKANNRSISLRASGIGCLAWNLAPPHEWWSLIRTDWLYLYLSANDKLVGLQHLCATNLILI